MDASAWRQGSLPEFLVRRLNKLGRSNLVINIATSGHTLTKIVDMMNQDFVWWLSQQTYDGILFSAGGNDFIDAARDTPPGQGLLKDMKGQPSPTNAADCIRQDALQKLVHYLNVNFAAIYETVRSSGKNSATPIYLNCYDTMRARNAPAIEGISGPWLYTAFTKNSIDASLWDQLTALLFKEVRKTVEGWAVGRQGVVLVPTSGRLVMASAGATGESGDWINEIHPNKSGWNKQVDTWLPLLPA